MIPRLVEPLVLDTFKSVHKIILVLGARQVGKTTLVKSIQQKLEAEGKKVLYLNADIDEERKVVNTTSIELLKKLVSGIDALIIDEAQRLDNPGLTLKVIYDNIPSVNLLATGSSSFDLKNKLSDPLTGRYIDFILYPFSFVEVLMVLSVDSHPIIYQAHAQSILTQILLYGLYPDIYLEGNPANKQLFLNKITESYLFRDILSFQRVRHPAVIMDLTRALAYQIGSEVNENELANRLKIDRKTVVSYLDILEKSFVIKRLYPYSRNPRREIGRNYKVYFVDIGMRNALIGDFHDIDIRPDIGVLWENFLVIERMKKYANTGKTARYYFWRSYGGAEVDFLEQIQSEPLLAFEFKYSSDSVSRGAASFLKSYAVPVKLVNQNNFPDFI